MISTRVQRAAIRIGTVDTRLVPPSGTPWAAATKIESVPDK